MTKAIKIILKKAEQTKKFIMLHNAFNKNYKPLKQKEYIYFPVIIESLPDNHDLEIVEVKLNTKELKPHSIKEALKDKITGTDYDDLVKSFEIIGDIAIIEIPDNLLKHKSEIAKAVTDVHANIKRVALKTSGMHGQFRTRDVEIIRGNNNTQTTYKENYCNFKVDITKMFYSSRLSTERRRITDLVKEKENVMVLFAGYGPFALTIAKHNPTSNVIGIELNPPAVELFNENIKLNKTNNCKAILGDVKIEALNHKQWADRVVMPLPKNALEYLPQALQTAKKGCMFHVYAFSSENDVYEGKIKIITNEANKLGLKIKIIRQHIVRPYAPNVFQIVIDFIVL